MNFLQHHAIYIHEVISVNNVLFIARSVRCLQLFPFFFSFGVQIKFKFHKDFNREMKSLFENDNLSYKTPSGVLA